MTSEASSELIGRLASLCGVGDAYHDYRGDLRSFSLRTKTEILRAMGFVVEDASQLRLAIARAERTALPGSEGASGKLDEAGRCFEPELLACGGRAWGFSVQLYALRSQHNWGIGDFGDLRWLLRAAANSGADFVGLNPLHALFLSQPALCSPYGASSRHFLNVLYLDVPQVAEFARCSAAQRYVATAQFSAQLTQLRSAALVDYPAVAALKFAVLELLFQAFRVSHLVPNSDRGAAFRQFVEQGGEGLGRHALFDALDASLADGKRGTGWLSWPQQYRDPKSDAVRDFANANKERVEFYLYLQWLAHEQLLGAQALARDLGMAIGIYGDFAVGANAAGSETWSDQQTYRLGAAIGAPPDPLARNGQDWGLPPQDPQALRRTDYLPFVTLLRNNLRYYGALRLDHIMALFRQWWVPRGLAAGDGGYVHYPMQRLLGLLAQQSQHARCLIIGEDLGTVPDELRAAMPQFGIYHYKIMLFEKEHAGQLLAPDRYVRRALAAATTHDLPPLRSWWEGGDIGLRSRLGLYANAELGKTLNAERELDCAALLRALWIEGLAPEAPREADGPFAPELALAVHRYLARSSAALVALQLEDLLGMSEPVNVPGTYNEYPNWRRKISVPLEEIFSRDAVLATLAAVRQQRKTKKSES